MSEIHPDWQSTDELSEPIGYEQASKESTSSRIEINREEERNTIPVAGISFSRKPAAIVGVLSVLLFGVIFINTTTEEIEPNAALVDVFVTEDGISPKQISVSKGYTIRFHNEHSSIQNLESSNLCTTNENCLRTDAIEAGEIKEFTIGENFPAGTYTYGSTSTNGLYGILVVQEGEVSSSILEHQQKQVAAFQAAPEETSKEIPDQVEKVSQIVIPTNSNTVDSKMTNPIKEVADYHNSLHGSASHQKKDFSHPDTGPGYWGILLVIISFGSYFTTAKLLQMH